MNFTLSHLSGWHRSLLHKNKRTKKQRTETDLLGEEQWFCDCWLDRLLDALLWALGFGAFCNMKHSSINKSHTWITTISQIQLIWGRNNYCLGYNLMSFKVCQTNNIKLKKMLICGHNKNNRDWKKTIQTS